MPKPKALLDWDDEDEGSPFEAKVYGLLRDAMERSDAAAKAIARIQKLLYEQEVGQREEPTLDPDKLAAQDGITTTVRKAEDTSSSGEFDQSSFYNVFTGINTMKLVRSLLKLLNMDHIEEEVMSTMIDNAFGRRLSGGTTPAAPQTEVAGSDMELLLNEIKRKAVRKERQKKRSDVG